MDTKTDALIEYNDKVLDYLQYMGYFEFVVEFHPSSVAQSIYLSNLIFFESGYSFRMAALVCFGATWEYQVLPYAREMGKSIH